MIRRKEASASKQRRNLQKSALLIARSLDEFNLAAGTKKAWRWYLTLFPCLPPFYDSLY